MPFPISPNTQSLAEVLAQLDHIIDWSWKENSRLGYFPYMYRHVTKAVAIGIEQGRFEDGPRMEQLDVVFANLYFRALANYRSGNPLPECWRLAFDVSSHRRVMLVQHLFLGMNAHIRHDLAIAAALVAKPGEIESLKSDFMEINSILAELIDQTQRIINRVSPSFWVVDILGMRYDEKLAAMMLRQARNEAWELAIQLTAAGDPNSPEILKTADQLATQQGKKLLHPSLWPLKMASTLAFGLERKSISKVLKCLQDEFQEVGQ